jgi:RNA-binding protein YhbY
VEAAAQLADRLRCDVAGTIGRVLILFRANPDEPRIVLPPASATEGE